MFATTFLGHQGWMFQSKRACLLVDPLLCEPFGHTQVLQYKVFPPRVWDLAAMPPVDAVILTHEHDDHFDIPSLAKLDRRIPIHLSARSSSAAHEILRTMGFSAHPLVPGSPVKCKDLELVAFAGDHMSVNSGDEWDTLPFLVRHTGGSGNFFSMVDIPLTESVINRARAHAPEPGIIGWTNNALDWSHMASYLAARDEGTQDCFVKMGVGHKLITETWGTPSAMLMCAGGFTFEGERAWMNERVFCVDTAIVCHAMKQIYPAEHFVPAHPGQTFTMEANRLRKVDPSTAFLTVEPIETWPSRARTDVAAIDYAPATGRRAFDDASLPALHAGLAALAQAMVGGPLFRSLHSLQDDELGEKKPSFAFSLRREGRAPLVYSYAATSCSFVSSADDPERSHVAGITCWASDLLAVLEGELGPIALTFGRARLWNALPERFGFDVFGALYGVSHPLRRPKETLATYERLWRRSAAVVPSVMGR